MITSSNSLCREWDAQSLRRRSSSRHVRYRAVPRTNRTPRTANTHNHSATSNTTELPVCAPSLPWQCSCADASLGEYTDVANLDGCALLLGLPPPTRSATRNCLAYGCVPIVVCEHWTPHTGSFPRTCRSASRVETASVFPMINT
jgi:hypothetical protein